MALDFLVRMRYDENESTHVKDLVGGYTITTNTGNAVLSALDPFGGNNALDLNNLWIIYGGTKEIKSNSLTLTTWVKVKSGGNNILAINSGGAYQGLDIGFPSSWRICTDNSSEADKVVGNYTIADDKWHFIEFSFDGTSWRVFVDGILDKSDINPNLSTYNYYKLLNTEMWVGQFPWGPSYDNSKFRGCIYDFCIIDGVWHTDNYSVPTTYVPGRMVLYLEGQEAWGIDSSRNFAKLNNNYSTMTDAQKISIFEATNGLTPTTSQLKTLTMPIKAVNYSEENTQPTCTVIAVSIPQTVTPKGRISLKNYAKLKGVSITGSTSGNGSVKVAVTKDNSTYQVYDTTNLAWVDINIADIGTDGMSLSDVAALTTTEWAAYDCMNSGIGFAYYLEMASTSDTAYTDELTLNVELLGELKSLVKGTDYDYSYVSNDVLQVKLYKNGDFRINYNPGES